jgi:hypothetical protein
MHIFMTACKALLDVSSFFLAAKNRYDSKGGWNFEAKISWVQDSYESIEEASSKDDVVRIEHVNNIKGDAFGARVLWGSKGNG